MDTFAHKKDVLGDAVVAKVGSNTLVDERGTPRKHVIRDMLSALSGISKNGGTALLVSSGAVKIGKAALGQYDADTALAASVGQPILMSHYIATATEMGMTVAELLLSRPHLTRRDQFLSLQKTIRTLSSNGVIPIINENDALVAHTEWSFGDNDGLATATAIALKARQLIILSHVDGLFEGDPTTNPAATLIREVGDINSELLKYVSHSASAGGRGGMLSKLTAARLCTAASIEVRIINGLTEGNLGRALRNEPVGTRFIARHPNRPLTNRDRWILAARNSSGSIEIDAGAVAALGSGKSLLAVGISNTYGQFNAGEIIEIIDHKRRGVAFGITDYSRDGITDLLHSKAVHGKQIIHADNLVALH